MASTTLPMAPGCSKAAAPVPMAAKVATALRPGAAMRIPPVAWPSHSVQMWTSKTPEERSDAIEPAKMVAPVLLDRAG